MCDVTCDVTSACNRLPVNDKITTWVEPSRRLHSSPVLDVLAVDNLPSLLPRESSVAFSADLLPYLRTLHRRADAAGRAVASDGDPVWDRCQDQFRAAVARLDQEG